MRTALLATLIVSAAGCGGRSTAPEDLSGCFKSFAIEGATDRNDALYDVYLAKETFALSGLVSREAFCPSVARVDLHVVAGTELTDVNGVTTKGEYQAFTAPDGGIDATLWTDNALVTLGHELIHHFEITHGVTPQVSGKHTDWDAKGFMALANDYMYRLPRNCIKSYCEGETDDTSVHFVNGVKL